MTDGGSPVPARRAIEMAQHGQRCVHTRPALSSAALTANRWHGPLLPWAALHQRSPPLLPGHSTQAAWIVAAGLGLAVLDRWG